MNNADAARNYYEWQKAFLSTGDRDLTHGAASVFRLAAFGDFGHHAWPAMETVAKEIGYSERSVRTHIGWARANQWLVIEKHPGRPDLYCISTPETPAEHICRDGRKRPADDQDLSPRKSLLLPDAPGSAPGIAGDTNSDHDWVEFFHSQGINGVMSPKEELALMLGVPEARSMVTASDDQVRRALTELADKRRSGALNSTMIHKPMVIGFIREAVVKDNAKRSRQSKNDALKLRKEEALAYAMWQDGDAHWYRNIDKAPMANLPTMLDVYDKIRADRASCGPDEPAQYREESIF